jgi:hypothetical protein
MLQISAQTCGYYVYTKSVQLHTHVRVKTAPPVSETLCFLVIYKSGQQTNSMNQIILTETDYEQKYFNFHDFLVNTIPVLMHYHLLTQR